MVRLQVAIQDKYPTHLNDLKLERTAQEAYFNGLREEYKPRIAYMLEKPDVTVTDLVEAVRHIEADAERQRIQRLDAAHYPSSTSAGYKPSYQRGPPKDNKDHRNKVNHDNRGVINAKPAQVDTESEEEDSPDPEEAERQRIANENAMWREGYYMCTLAKADEADLFFNACYNCREEGHQWHECPKPLHPGLQEVKDLCWKRWRTVKHIWGWQRESREAAPPGRVKREPVAQSHQCRIHLH